VRTRQIEDLLRFYGAIGIELVREQHGKGPVHYACLMGDAVFEIYPTSDDAPADATTRLGFTVENLTALINALKSIGVEMVTEPKQTEWGYRAVARDPDGRSVELVQR
jgi:predicted enzyme related to lactoylglutathione lyase